MDAQNKAAALLSVEREARKAFEMMERVVAGGLDAYLAERRADFNDKLADYELADNIVADTTSDDELAALLDQLEGPL